MALEFCWRLEVRPSISGWLAAARSAAPGVLLPQVAIARIAPQEFLERFTCAGLIVQVVFVNLPILNSASSGTCSRDIRGEEFVLLDG
jgi:hypothetical protein